MVETFFMYCLRFLFSLREESPQMVQNITGIFLLTIFSAQQNDVRAHVRRDRILQ